VIRIAVDISKIKSIFGSKNYHKGWSYWSENRVKMCYKVKNWLYGLVEGRRIYKVRVNLEKLRDNMCSCPLGGNCKHVVATLLAFSNGEYIDADAVINKFMILPASKKRKILARLIIQRPGVLKVLVGMMERKKYRFKAEAIIDKALNLCQSDLSYVNPERYVDRMYALMEKLEKMRIEEECFDKLLQLYMCVMQEEIGYGYDDVKYTLRVVMEKVLDEKKAKVLITKVVDYVLSNYEPPEIGGVSISGLKALIMETLELASKFNLIEYLKSETERKVKLFRTNKVLEAGKLIESTIEKYKEYKKRFYWS